MTHRFKSSRFVSKIVTGLFILGISLGLTFTANQAHAFGVYADVPLAYSFSDCSGSCEFSVSGLKAGVILPGNMVLGVESYTVTDDEAGSDTEVAFQMVDVAYLLPIPLINIMVGVGAGDVKLSSASNSFSQSDTATQVWASLGFTLAAIVDLHVGYHAVNASVEVNSAEIDLSGNMVSFGAMINF